VHGLHQPGFANEVSRKPMFDRLDVSRVTNLYGTGMTWDFVKRLREHHQGALVLKGIVTHEDAKEALKYGVDALIVSNHAAVPRRACSRPSRCCPKSSTLLAAVFPFWSTGASAAEPMFLKGLALGASAVCIGRPYCWGLAAFGQPGVEAVLGIMQEEFETIMRQGRGDDHCSDHEGQR